MVAIKDFGMPSCCANCDFCVEDKYADMTCVLLGSEWEESDYNENHRDEYCPLVEIEERKVGKWIRVDHTKVKCSNCDITHLIAQYPHGVIDYCPNCGSYNQSIIENERQ